MNQKDLFHIYADKMSSIDDAYFKNVNKDLFNGHNSYLRTRMKGASFFNDEWINKIEDCIYELGQITNNPLEVTKTEGELTPIELAKKINYESIQHLSSHSQYVKEIDEEGNVIPSKILAQFHKEEIHTYENRFIATFIRRLMLFVEKRYDFIRSTVNFDTKDILYIKNKSIVDGQEVEIETKVTVKKENEDAQSKIGREYVKRVEDMRRYVNYFYTSPFMKEFKTEKNVRKPILQTNIIRKNPYYRKCYETFLFIEKFNSLGVEYALDQRFQTFSEKERKELTYILASNLLSLGSTETSKTYKKTHKSYKPKLLSSIDDEMFVYGDLVKGPIEFIRADEKYLEYLNSKVDKSIPQKPNKAEKEYFKDEIKYRKDVKQYAKELDLLLKRKQRQIALWEKKVLALIEARNLEEAKEAEAKLEALRKQQNSILERKRKEIIAAALDEKAEIKAQRLEEIKKAEAEAKAAEEASKKAILEAVEKAREAMKVEAEAQKEQIIEPEVQEEVIVPAQEPDEVTAPVVKESKNESSNIEAISEEQVIEKDVAVETEQILVTEDVKVEPTNEEITKPVVEEHISVSELPVQEAISIEESQEKNINVQEPVHEKPKAEESAQEGNSKELNADKSIEETNVEEKATKIVEKEKSSRKTGDFKNRKAKKEAKKVQEKPQNEETFEEPLDLPKERKSILKKIPGSFIVKSNKGYVISKTEFTEVKSKAHVFDDFNVARRYKEMFGGKVIKL